MTSTDAGTQPAEDPQDVAARSAEAMLAADDASRALGMTLESVAPGRAEVAMTVRADMVNGYGICHGGLIAALADTAFAVACNTYGKVTVAAGFDISFLEPVKAGDHLVASAQEVVRRDRSGIYDVTVVRRPGTGQQDEVVAEFRGRSHTVSRPPR